MPFLVSGSSPSPACGRRGRRRRTAYRLRAAPSSRRARTNLCARFTTACRSSSRLRTILHGWAKIAPRCQRCAACSGPTGRVRRAPSRPGHCATPPNGPDRRPRPAADGTRWCHMSGAVRTAGAIHVSVASPRSALYQFSVRHADDWPGRASLAGQPVLGPPDRAR